MEIKDQMTATVRLTKQAAEKLGKFLNGWAPAPKNMNDALNLALAHLPERDFQDEVWELQQDKAKAILDIKARFEQTEFLKRSDYFFMILIMKEAVSLNQKERISKNVLKQVLCMTLDLWGLCKQNDKEGRLQRYMLGNIGGNTFNGPESTLDSYVPHYIESSQHHPFPRTLEFALRNPEVMLRDELTKIMDMQINQKMAPYFRLLYNAAARWHYLLYKEPIEKGADLPYSQVLWKDFGDKKQLKFSQLANQNVAFALSKDREFEVFLTANNIVDIEEFFSVFLEDRKTPWTYTGEKFTLNSPLEHEPDGDYRFVTPVFLVSIPSLKFKEMGKLVRELSEDPEVMAVINTAKEKFGEI